MDTMMYGCQRTIYNAAEGGTLSVLFDQTSSDPDAPEIFGLKWDVTTSKSYAGCTIKIPADYSGILQTADYLVIWVQGSPSEAQFEIGLVGCLDPDCAEKREWKEKVTLMEEGRQVSFSLARPELNGERLLIVEEIVLGFSHIFGEGSHTGTLMIGGIGFGP
jgi:hypothetical protein